MTLKVCPQHCLIRIAGSQLQRTFMTSKDSNYYGCILEVQVPDAKLFLHRLQETVIPKNCHYNWRSPLSGHHCSKDTVSLLVLYTDSSCTLDYCTLLAGLVDLVSYHTAYKQAQQ